MRIATAFCFFWLMGSMVALPAFSMQMHHDPGWKSAWGQEQPISAGSLNFTNNLSTLFVAFQTAQELQNVPEQIACFEHSWWQLRSMWNLEINKRPSEISAENLGAMAEITRRIPIFSNNLLQFMKSNERKNWQDNASFVAMVKSLLATIGSSKCLAPKSQQFVADRLFSYANWAQNPGRENNKPMVQEMVRELQNALMNNADLCEYYGSALYQD